MKIQDLIFIVIFLAVLISRKERLAVVVGLFALILSMPFFAFWIFFTAQRLVMYAAAFFLLAAISQIWHIRQIGKEKR